MKKHFVCLFIRILMILLVVVAVPTAIFTVSSALRAAEESEAAYLERQKNAAASVVSVVEDKFNDLKNVCIILKNEEWLDVYCKGTGPDANDYDVVHRIKYSAKFNSFLSNVQILQDAAIIVPKRDTVVTSKGWFTGEEYAFTYYPGHVEDFRAGGMEAVLPAAVYTPCVRETCTGSNCKYTLPVFFDFYEYNRLYQVLFLVDKRLFNSYFEPLAREEFAKIQISIGDSVLYQSEGGAEETAYDYEQAAPAANLTFRFRLAQKQPMLLDSILMNQFFGSMFIFFFLSLLSVPVALLLTRPAWRISEKLRPYLPKQKTAGQSGREPNPFKQFEASLNTAMEEFQISSKQMERYKRIVSNDELLFNILISNDTEQYIDEICDFWSWFNKDGYCSVILLNETQGLPQRDSTDLVLETLEDCAPRNLVEYRVMNILNSDLALLLYFGKEEKLFAEKHYAARYSAVEERLRVDLPGCAIAAGVIARGVLGIQTSYHQARKELLNHSYISGGQESEIQYFYPISLELQLINNLKLGKEEKCAEILDVIFQQNNDLLLSDAQNCKLLSIIFDTFLRYALENSVDIAACRQGVNSIIQSRSYKKAPAVINDACAMLCQSIAQKKDRDMHNPKMYLYEYVSTNYFDPNMSLQSLSDQYKIPVSTLSKLFKETVGFNFYDFLSRTRVEHAIQLIRGKKSTISEIGRMVGYENYASFKRAFVKHTGINPSEFKELESAAKK